MFKRFFLLLICLSILVFSNSAIAADSIVEQTDVTLIEQNTLDYINDELIVWLNTYFEPTQYGGNVNMDFLGVQIQEIDALFTDSEEGIQRWASLSSNRFPFWIKLCNGYTASSAANILKENPNVLEVEYNYIVELDHEEPEFIPSTSVNSGTGTRSDSQGTDYTQWAHDYLMIESVWSMGFYGSDSIRVAVLDAGFAEHDDLEDNLDMSLAYDVYDDDTDVTPLITHGNRVAGIIGADYDDGGVNGLCQNVTMIPIKVADNTSNAYASGKDIKDGVNKAVELGVDIINLSYGLAGYGTQITEILEDNQILLVTSAGNNDSDMTVAASHKCNNSDYWIVVGAMTQSEAKHANSNFSSTYVDLFAPGEYTTTTGINNDYKYIDQTSGAAPHVTAACALLMSKATHKTPLQIRQLLLDNVDVLNGFDEYCVTGGTLSIRKAVNALYAENRGAYTKGDVTGDGYVDQYDYIACRRIYFETLTPTTQQIDAADVDNSGEVDPVDVSMINRYYFKTLYFPPY